jgi:hypothetical protein
MWAALQEVALIAPPGLASLALQIINDPQNLLPSARAELSDVMRTDLGIRDDGLSLA